MKQGMANALVFPIALCVLLSGMGIGFIGVPAGGVSGSDDKVSGLLQHAPIRIDSNADFTLANGVNNTGTGNGTVWNPWVIENLDINGTGFGYCIYIGNTTDYFVVRNCSLYNTSDIDLFASEYCLELFRANNSVINNNTILNQEGGICVSESHNNTLDNNTFLNYWWGIYLMSSENNTISNNSMKNTHYCYGIWLTNSHTNNIINNNITDNYHNINLESSEDNTISNNLLSWIDVGYGINILWDSENNLVLNNTINSGRGKEIGIESSYNQIINNTINSNCTWRTGGSVVIYAPHCTLKGNNMTKGGIDIMGWTNDVWNQSIDSTNLVNEKPVYYFRNITGGFAPFDAGEIILTNCSNMLIENLNIGDSGIPIQIGYSDNITISNNNISSNLCNGIELWFSKYCNITGNNIRSNVNFDVIFIYSNFSNIFHNNLSNVNDGYTNYWDNGYPIGGNYWDAYAGVDSNADGIGDSPYLIDGDSSDRYPLMTPYTGQTLGEFIPPYAISSLPAGANVPLNTTFTIQWNETMDWTSVNNSFNYTDNVTVWTSADGTWTHDAATNTSVFTPTSALAHNTTYWVNVNITATDMVGNPLDQDQNGTGGYWTDDVLTWNFTTVLPEAIPPFALSYTPNGTAEPINTTFVIVWNETMDWTSVNNSFQYTDGINWFNSTNGTWVHDAATNTSTFTPSQKLEYDTLYGVMINSSATDIVGNMLDQDGDGTPGEFPQDVVNWTFKIIDAPPTVISVAPGHLDTLVDPNTNFTIHFSESMNTTTVEMAFTYSDGVNNFNVTSGTVLWGILDKTMIFDPTDVLVNDTMYDLTIDGSIAMDLDGRLLDGNGDDVSGDDYMWVFTTWLEPPAPTVEYGIPADGSTMVNVNTHIQIKFDFRMDPASVAGAFSISGGNALLDANDGAFSWSNNVDIMTYQPHEYLDYEEEYTVRLEGTAMSYVGKLMDNNDNDLGEGTPVDDYVFSFETSAEPPVVDSTYPANGANNVPITLPAINITFNTAMDNNSVENALHISPHIPGNITWSPDNREMSLAPNGPLNFYSEYTVTINGNMATDVDGVWLDGDEDGAYGDDYQFRFVTEGAPDLQPPAILRVFPYDNWTTVPINVYIQVVFNESVNRTSVENAFTMSNGTAFISGSFSWNVDSTSFKYYPSENLSYNTTHTCTVNPGVEDLVGNKMTMGYTWTFLTGVEQVSEREPIAEFWYYMAIIFILLILLGFQWFKNKHLVKEIRKTRVNNKKLKRHMKKLDPNYGAKKAVVEGTAPEGEVKPELIEGGAEKPEVPETGADDGTIAEAGEPGGDEKIIDGADIEKPETPQTEE